MGLTTADKLQLIDEYLWSGTIDPRWEEMIQEYRELLLESLRNERSKEKMTGKRFKKLIMALGFTPREAKRVMLDAIEVCGAYQVYYDYLTAEPDSYEIVGLYKYAMKEAGV